jgi:hypothetical protein
MGEAVQPGQPFFSQELGADSSVPELRSSSPQISCSAKFQQMDIYMGIAATSCFPATKSLPSLGSKPNCRYTASAAVIAGGDELNANSPSPLHQYEALGPEFAALSA